VDPRLSPIVGMAADADTTSLRGPRRRLGLAFSIGSNEHHTKGLYRGYGARAFRWAGALRMGGFDNVARAAWAAVALLAISNSRLAAGPSISAPSTTTPPSTGLAIEGAIRWLFFSGVDIWRDGRFSHGGLVFSPKGLDREGWVLKLMSNGGLYRFRSGSLKMDVIGQEMGGTLMAGWRFIGEATTFVAMGGVDIREHRLLPDDPSAGLRGRYKGMAGAFEVWHVPRPGLMLAAHGTYSTIGPSYSARIAFGWRLFDRFYVGPEKQILASGNTHQQIRLGIHLTGLRLNGTEWSAGLGWSTGNDARHGLYGRLGMFTRH